MILLELFDFCHFIFHFHLSCCSRPPQQYCRTLHCLSKSYYYHKGQRCIDYVTLILSQIEWRNPERKENFCTWNGTFRSDRSDRSKRTTSRGGPKYSGWTEPKRTFPFDFRPKFPEKTGLMESAQDLQSEIPGLPEIIYESSTMLNMAALESIAFE